MNWQETYRSKICSADVAVQAIKSHSRVFMTARLTVRHIFFKESYVSISRRNGFILLTDGVHLNEQGASLVADVMEKYLSSLDS